MLVFMRLLTDAARTDSAARRADTGSGPVMWQRVGVWRLDVASRRLHGGGAAGDAARRDVPENHDATREGRRRSAISYRPSWRFENILRTILVEPWLVTYSTM